MKRNEFFYHLPGELIAQYPLQRREDSRLLCLDKMTGVIEDKNFGDLSKLLKPNDLLVFNDSKVITARLFGVKKSGGKVEILIERFIDDQRVFAHIYANKPPKLGSQIILECGDILVVDGREDNFFILVNHGEKTIFSLMEEYGHVPLPPYIKRKDSSVDKDRYQTVFSRVPGSVAAPTAGLHFSEKMLETLTNNKIGLGFITLHIGAGTFQPVRTEHIEEHVMHKEWFQISESLCAQVDETKKLGGRIIAVGTTVVRCLEFACSQGALRPMSNDTNIFIYPGYRFKIIEGMITNFHLPESTLLMLISAFAGKENVFKAYAHAVSQEYRFFSYGDAMFIS